MSINYLTQLIKERKIRTFIESKGRALNALKSISLKAQKRVAQAESPKLIKKIQKGASNLISLQKDNKTKI